MSGFDGKRREASGGNRFGALRGGDSISDLNPAPVKEVEEVVEKPAEKPTEKVVEPKIEEKAAPEIAEDVKAEEKSIGAKDIASKIKEKNKKDLKAKEEAKKLDPNRKINRTIYLKAGNLDIIDKYAKKNGLTIGNVMDYLIEEYFKN